MTGYNRSIDTSCAIARTSVPSLDAILGHAFPILDHGFIRIIDYMGDQSAIAQGARTSYGEGTKAVSTDKGLLRYLFKHRHTSPFELCEIKFHIKLPIFVARQWIRHRVANVNEYSGRYSIMPNEFYLPPPEQVCFQSKSNNQGRGDVIPVETAQAVIDLLADTSKTCFKRYDALVDDDVSRELARIGLTLNSYTEWYWKIDLHNLLHFVRLRMDSHAQWEIRVYAEQIFEFLKLWVPDVVQAFIDYSLEARLLSRMEIDLLQRVMAGETIVQANSGLSKREWNEFQPFLSKLTSPVVTDADTGSQTETGIPETFAS